MVVVVMEGSSSSSNAAAAPAAAPADPRAAGPEGGSSPHRDSNDDNVTAIAVEAADLAASSPTCAKPSSDKWPGAMGFQLFFQQLSNTTKNKSWDVS